MKKQTNNYYAEQGIKITTKQLKAQTTECECGNVLPYPVSPFKMCEKRVCPKCGAIHYVEHQPSNFAMAFQQARTVKI